MPVEANQNVPLAVARLLAARYPTLDIDPAWLSQSVRELRARNVSSAPVNDDQLAQSVRRKLLDTDLARVVTPSYCRLPSSLNKATSGRIGDTGRGAVLLQIESMIDIGHSSSAQLEIAEARRDIRTTPNGQNFLDSAQQEHTKVTDTPTSGDHMNNFQAQEDDKNQSSTIFPRRMLKLELSDGSNEGLNRMFAIETSQVTGLDMNTTKIGAKLLIKGSLVRSGYILLSSKEVTIEGGQVHEKALAADTTFISTLRAKLGKPPVSHIAASDVGTVPAARLAPSAVQSDATIDIDELEDGTGDSFLLAALVAEEQASAQKFPPVPRNAAKSPSPPSSARRLMVPESLKQKGGDRHALRPKGTSHAEDSIELLDSDDDELFASLGEDMLNRPFAASTREDPIVIESSPEP